MPAGSDAFNQAMHTANVWLADIGSALGTLDRRYSQRILRTWLHTLRDRLTVNAASKFGQQLPELLRGSYYDGWEPNRVPIKYDTDQYVQRFAAEAAIPPSEVPMAAAAVTEVIGGHMSPGQLAEALEELPAELRTMIIGTVAAAPQARTAAPASVARAADEQRIATLENQVTGLTDAVRTLAHGLENSHFAERGIDQTRVTRAARLADEILIAASTRTP